MTTFIVDGSLAPAEGDSEHPSAPETGAPARASVAVPVAASVAASAAARDAVPATVGDIDWAAQVASVAIVSLDTDGIIRSWNRGARRIKGYTADEVIGTSFERFYRSEDRERGLPHRLLSIAVRTGSVEDTGWRVRADGTVFWAHVVITAIRDEVSAVTGFMKIVRDLTESKRDDDERDRFLRAFAHDLLSPITALRGYVDLLEDELAEQSELVQHVSRVSDHLMSMIAELTMHVRGDGSHDQDDADVAPIVHEAAELVLPGDVNGRVKIRGTGRASLVCDRAALRRALANVIDNAAKYSEGSIDIVVATTRDATTIAVTDTGRGIDPADIAGIFEPYQRGRLSDPSDGGTGLGLASVRSLVQRLGGDVQLTSALGTGTTVTLLLPSAT